MIDATNQFTVDFSDGFNQNISTSSNILPSAGLLFTKIQSNSFIQFENFIFFNVCGFNVHFHVGIPSISSKNCSGFFNKFIPNFHCYICLIAIPKTRNMECVFMQRYRRQIAWHVLSKRLDTCHTF